MPVPTFTHGATEHGLEARLAAREAEIDRLVALCTQLRAQLVDGVIAAGAARRMDATTAAELGELRTQLAVERNEHAACRDQRRRAQERNRELEHQLAVQERQARSDQDDGERRRAQLESRLCRTEHELATSRAALAIAATNLSTLDQAHADALYRLAALEARLAMYEP